MVRYGILDAVLGHVRCPSPHSRGAARRDPEGHATLPVSQPKRVDGLHSRESQNRQETVVKTASSGEIGHFDVYVPEADTVG